MACLLKAPSASAKGCITFTTPERDKLIMAMTDVRVSVEALKNRYVLGLHHNWHDYNFEYQPLFDFSMAGEGDLIERTGAEFPRIDIDACNFAPSVFSLEMPRVPYWDLFNVSRAVAFKGVPEFIRTVRTLYDAGHRLRVLMLLAMPPEPEQGGFANLRSDFEKMFSRDERQLFSLVTMDWDYPFPLDLETLAFFYRSSRVFVHPAPEERRCRTAAYAWASGLPVVARANVASIMSRDNRRAPYWFEYDGAENMGQAILKALDSGPDFDPGWGAVAKEFQGQSSLRRLDGFLTSLAAERGHRFSQVIARGERLDIRLGRHHGLSLGGNRVDQDLLDFCRWALTASDGEIAQLLQATDPELQLAASLGQKRDDAGGEGGDVMGSRRGPLSRLKAIFS